MDTAEGQVAKLFSEIDLKIRQHDKHEKRLSKTPDFQVFKDSNLKFYCEVKTIERVELLQPSALSTPPGIVVDERQAKSDTTAGLSNDPVFNSIAKKIHDSVKQFDAVNPNLEYPNVLALVNHNIMCDYYDLIAVTTGNFISEQREKYPIYWKFAEGHIRKEKFRIHLYIWLDDFKSDYYLFNTSNKSHLYSLCEAFDIDPRSVQDISQQK